MTPEELEARKIAALEMADQAFWAQIALYFPEATTGDFPPDAHMSWQSAMESALNAWLASNLEQ